MLMVQLSAEAEAVAPTIELLEAKVKRLVRQSRGGPAAVAPRAARGAALQQTKQKRSPALQRCNEVPLQQTKKKSSAAVQRCNEVPLQRLSSHAY